MWTKLPAWSAARSRRGVGAVRFLVARFAGDALILKAGEFAQAVGLDVRRNVVLVEIVTDVAVEIAIGGIAGITFDGGPDLNAGFDIATESGRAGLGEERGIDAVAAGRGSACMMAWLSTMNQRISAS